MRTRRASVPVEIARDGLDFGARRGVRGREASARQATVREKALRHADAADLQRLEALRLEAAADDEFGRAAADVDDEPRLSVAGSTCATPS